MRCLRHFSVCMNNMSIVAGWPLETREIFKGKSKGKGQAIPVQVWTGPKGYGNLRLPDMETVDALR